MNFAQIGQALAEIKEILLGNSTAKTQLGEAQSKITELANQLAEAQGKVSLLTTEHATAIKAKDDLIAKMTSDHAAALEAKGKEVDLKAGKKAGDITAKQGIPPLAEIPEGTGKEGNPGSQAKSKLEEYNSITDPKARGDFFKANRAEIFSGK